MENEQAPALGSNDLADLASFLSDTPEPESVEDESETQSDEPTADGDTGEAENDQQDESEDESQDASDEEEAKPAPDRKVAIKTTAEDGTETTIDVSESELVKGYQRQADYTRKTQALATRENEAVQFLQTKHDEFRNQYVSQAETARAAVAQMAGIKTESEMEQLAHSDPAAWVAENQRQRQIGNFLNGLDQQIAGEKNRANHEHTQRQSQALKSAFESTWVELGKAGIDKPALAKIYQGASKNYGFTDAELGNVYDHRLVKMMQDAQAYRTLKEQKPAVSQKLANAPKLPTRQAQPAQERADKALNEKFRSGRAKLNDLAAFLR